MRNRHVTWLVQGRHLLYTLLALLLCGSTLAQWPPPPTNTLLHTYVSIVKPPNGAIFTNPPAIPLVAWVIAEPAVVGQSVTGVEFFADGVSLGVATNGFYPPLSPLGTTAFSLTWTSPPAGPHVLLAKALAENGGSVVSRPVNIYVTRPGTNLPPVVYIATPMDGAKFAAPANVPICANAFDPDGTVTTVEFFEGTNSLGVTTNNPLSAGARNPFCLIWSNVPPGNYVLTAKATDDGGASSISAAVNISVVTPPPPTNYPPLVRITSPPNGALFRAPVNIPIYAYARDFDDSVATVEFFAGTNSLGLGQGLCAVVWPVWSNPPVVCPTNLFVLVWSNAPVGSYTLTAKATDSRGASSVSPGVNITVLPSPPPPTNRPPILSIAAIDPIAIEGTNCWPWLGLTNRVPTWSNWYGGGTIFGRFFTNCGPKNATFAVRRFGATNDDLAVTYDIGGTATNGVDYVPLSGSVLIPAGERSALITVVPLDDGPPDINSTVVLKLDPGTNYVVGFPNKAAALIIDSGWPRPVTGMLPGNIFNLSATGPDGAWFHVDYSTDLINWTSICTNQVVNGSIDFVDPDASQVPARFYRAVPDAGPPGE